MRRAMLVLAPLLVLMACADPAAPNPTDPSATALAAYALDRDERERGPGRRLSVKLIEETYELDLPRITQCVGEPIMVTGRTRMDLQLVVIPGGRFHGTFHMSEQGSSGVGMITGQQYRFMQVQNEGVRMEGDLPYTDTAIFDRRVISHLIRFP